MKTAHRFLVHLIIGLLLPAVSLADATMRDLHVVDIQKVIAESTVGRSAREKATNDMKERQIKLDSLQKDFIAAQENLKKQSAVLSRDALEKQRELVAAKQTELKRVFEDEREAMTRKQEAALMKIVKEIDTSIASLAKEKKWDFVLEKDKAFVLYASPAIDVTEEVIASLNARAKKLEE